MARVMDSCNPTHTSRASTYFRASIILIILIVFARATSIFTHNLSRMHKMRIGDSIASYWQKLVTVHKSATTRNTRCLTAGDHRYPEK